MLTHFSISQQGQSHIQRDIPCQDYSASKRIRSEKLGMNFVLAADADGVGSCEFSDRGAQMAVNSLLTCLEHNLTQKIQSVTDESMLDLLRHGFHYALGQVNALAEREELPFVQFDSTLTGVIYDGENVWYGHIGDDGAVALYTDGTYELFTHRHKGAEAHSLFPLRNEDLWEFGKAPKPVAAFALMTDGVLDYCVGMENMGNRVLFPFLEPALTEVMDSDEKAELLRKDWDELFRDTTDNENIPFYARALRTKISDDISFVVAMNSDAVAKVEPVPFDMEKWEADTIEMKKRQHEALYAHLAEWDAKHKKQKLAPNAEPAAPAADTKPAEKSEPVETEQPSKPEPAPRAAQQVVQPVPKVPDAPPPGTDNRCEVKDSLCNLIDAASKMGNVLGKKMRKSIDKIKAERAASGGSPAQPGSSPTPKPTGQPVSAPAAEQKPKTPQDWDIKMDD